MFKIIFSFVLIQGIFLNQTLATTESWITFLKEKAEKVQSINTISNIRNTPLHYLYNKPTYYDFKDIQKPKLCTPAFCLTAIYDAEIALKSHDRERFLHLTDFIYKNLVIKNINWTHEITDEDEYDYLQILKSHAACLMQKAGFSEKSFKTHFSSLPYFHVQEWKIRLQVAKSINDISFHQRVQKILMLQEDYENIQEFIKVNAQNFLATPDFWINQDKNDSKLSKIIAIITTHNFFHLLQKGNLNAFQDALANDYETRIQTLKSNSSLIDSLSQQKKLNKRFVQTLVNDMYNHEFEKFISYLSEVNSILHQNEPIFPLECGIYDGKTSNTCGLNSLLYKDVIKGNIQSLRQESCTLIKKYAQSSSELQEALRAALIRDKKDDSPLTLHDFATKPIPFESAATSGFYSTGFVKRPLDDWITSYKGQHIIYPAIVQADMLELVAFVHDYNIIIMGSKSMGSKSENTNLLSHIQSISIFSSYQEIRFLIHSTGHYQAIHRQSFAPPFIFSYRKPTDWYRHKIKNILESSD